MLKSSRFLRNFVENHGDLTLFIAANTTKIIVIHKSRYIYSRS